MPDSGGVYLVPAFAGLGAPHWDPYARGTIVGITRGTTAGHIARAALEGIAFQVADLLDADAAATPASTLAELRVDGGAAANNLLMQFQADLLGVPVVRPDGHRDDGARRRVPGGPGRRLLGLDRGAARNTGSVDRRFEPAMPRGAGRRAARAEWREALEPLEGLDRAGRITMRRPDMIARLDARRDPWDIVVIGGGATGVGIAVDAASRGYDVLLLEQHDFGKGTSSRSTKLVHGGVRYLEQGNIALVMEALKERGLLRQNAPHLVSNLAFVVPNYDWWEAPFYGIGLKVYNLLAGKYGFGTSRDPLARRDAGAAADDQDRRAARRRRLLRRPVRRRAAADQPGGDGGRAGRDAAQLRAGRRHHARAPTASSTASSPPISESGRQWTIGARVVVNAGGPFSDAVRRLADPDAQPLIAPSQGIHLVFDRSFLPGDAAIMVPHTTDGRVMFAIPWHGHTLVGTTDTPIATPTLEPRPLQEEIDFILETAGQYLHKAPTRADVLSVFVGIRPLVKSGDGKLTAALSRDHTIHIDASGLLTITGGKWTTYRNMAEDTVDQAADLARLTERPCVTRTLNVHGFHTNADRFGALASTGRMRPRFRI